MFHVDEVLAQPRPQQQQRSARDPFEPFADAAAPGVDGGSQPPGMQEFWARMGYAMAAMAAAGGVEHPRHHDAAPAPAAATSPIIGSWRASTDQVTDPACQVSRS